MQSSAVQEEQFAGFTKTIGDAFIAIRVIQLARCFRRDRAFFSYTAGSRNTRKGAKKVMESRSSDVRENSKSQVPRTWCVVFISRVQVGTLELHAGDEHHGQIESVCMYSVVLSDLVYSKRLLLQTSGTGVGK